MRWPVVEAPGREEWWVIERRVDLVASGKAFCVVESRSRWTVEKASSGELTP